MLPVIFASYRAISLWGRMHVIEKHNKTPLDLNNTDYKNNSNKLQKQSAYLIKFLLPGKYQEGLGII